MPWHQQRQPMCGWTIHYHDPEVGYPALYGVFPLDEYGDLRFNMGTIFPTWERAYSFFEDRVNEVLADMAEDGKVAYVESGRDCDGVEYSGCVHIMDATLEAYEALDTLIGEWADGPYQLALMRVSKTRSVTYESRDLVMEAHEDGHRHSICSQFP